MTSDDRLILLGTAGGPATYPNDEGQARFGVASALVVDDKVYLVDCGQGVDRQLKRARVGGTGFYAGYEHLDSVFITHMHCDHTIDYFNIVLFGGSSGINRVAHPVKVYGPADRGELVPVQGSAPAPPLVSPRSPNPGMVEMTERLFEAFAADLNDRLRDSRKADPRAHLEVTDIQLPEIQGFVSPNLTPHPDMEPFRVHEDARVRVTATLVQHAPVFPAFAFRFDCDSGSVVFSGDTGPSDNLVRLASGADILVHEVLDPTWLDELFPDESSPQQAAVIEHLRSSHTSVHEVGPLAERAGVRTLVLNHLVPASRPPERWLAAKDGFNGRLIVGEDLLAIPLSD